MSMHDAILTALAAALQEALVDSIPADDPARAGLVMKGPLQGNPDPDQARIAVMVHENDPDSFYGSGQTSSLTGSWEDEPYEVECGGEVTMKRRFTVKARCLLVNTQEDLASSRRIASTVRGRIEKALLAFTGTGLASDGEYVSMGVNPASLKGEMVQAGGPPDSYDYHLKVRFELFTTQGVQS